MRKFLILLIFFCSFNVQASEFYNTLLKTSPSMMDFGLLKIELEIEFINRPRHTGTVVITNIVKLSIKIFIGGAFVPIKYTEDIDTIIGSVNIVIILTNAVYEIDSAVSPLDILVIICINFRLSVRLNCELINTRAQYGLLSIHTSASAL